MPIGSCPRGRVTCNVGWIRIGVMLGYPFIFVGELEFGVCECYVFFIKL